MAVKMLHSSLSLRCLLLCLLFTSSLVPKSFAQSSSVVDNRDPRRVKSLGGQEDSQSESDGDVVDRDTGVRAVFLPATYGFLRSDTRRFNPWGGKRAFLFRFPPTFVEAKRQFAPWGGKKRSILSATESGLMADVLAGLQDEDCSSLFRQIRAGFNSWGGRKRGFNSWGGKRDGFSSWGGKRDGFDAWGGKRDGFDAWGGKRDGFDAWGGKRDGFDAWGGKRDGFDAWGGKRNGFNSWGGKRNVAEGLLPGEELFLTKKDFGPWGGKRDFGTWGGKRTGFNSWGGKRKLDATETINDEEGTVQTYGNEPADSTSPEE